MDALFIAHFKATAITSLVHEPEDIEEIPKETRLAADSSHNREALRQLSLQQKLWNH